MRRSALRSCAIAAAAVAVAGAVASAASASSPDPLLTYTGSHAMSATTDYPPASAIPPATPDGPCGPGSLPETVQGRAPLADFSDGRALQGYTCNTTMISRYDDGGVGGYRTHIYTDSAGHTCAYYDTTDVVGVSFVEHGVLGTTVLDMTDPAHPVQTASLITPAFDSPHESMTISPTRGLLMAAAATNATGPAVVDIYDLKADCRHPKLLAESPFGILGHEGNITADGNTFWVSANAQGILAAVDISNPSLPTLAYFSVGQMIVHGFSLSPDGKTLYAARNGACICYGANAGNNGVQIWDVSQVQERKPNPQVTLLGSVTWPEVSVPQTTIPITEHNHHYLVEVDEYAGNVTADLDAPVGAARIIDVEDPTHPFVVSNLRLQVDEPANRNDGSQVNDPNANNADLGYAAHYCSVPRQDDPLLVACSFLGSGLRIFNIADPAHPVEVAYFNHPADTSGDSNGSADFSQPSWDFRDHSVYFADSAHGFFDVGLTDGVWPDALTPEAGTGNAASAADTSAAAPAGSTAPAATAAPATPATAPSSAVASARPASDAPAAAGSSSAGTTTATSSAVRAAARPVTATAPHVATGIQLPAAGSAAGRTSQPTGRLAYTGAHTALLVLGCLLLLAGGIGAGRLRRTRG